MTGKHDQYIVSYAEGRGRNLAKAKNRTASWAALKAKLSKPYVTPETRKHFDTEMSKDEQDTLKAFDGWISGAQCKDNHRSLKNVLPRDLLTIDVDYAPKHILEDIQEGFMRSSGYEGFWHSSRRHTPEDPRVRFFAPLARKVTLEEYYAIVRFVAWKMDPEMKLVDPVSFRGAQMMYKPTCSKDDRKHYFTFEQHGDMIDPDKILAEFVAQFGDWTDMANWPRHPEEALRHRKDQADDPLDKKGPVGTFCRAYSIEAAMEKFIPGTYIEGDTHSANPRYTYAGATSSNGAVVYDDGRFLFSNHGSDPCGDTLVNAFDMVRIHLFEKLDEKIPAGTPITKHPSYKALIYKIQDDPGYKRQLADDNYDLGAMFDEAGVEEEKFTDEEDEADDSADRGSDERTMEEDIEDVIGRVDPSDDAGDGVSAEDENASRFERPKPSKPRKKRDNWFSEDLEFNSNGEIRPNAHNAAIIIQNDPRWLNVIWYNEFSNQIVARRDIKGTSTVAAYKCKDKDFGDVWQDFHDTSVRTTLAAPNGPGKKGYGLNLQDIIVRGAVEMTARLNSFHPVKDYLLNCKPGTKAGLVDTFLIRYLGLPDTEYHRMTSRMAVLASVVRIFEPGHKFDFAVIIEGPQGIGKSTLIRALYGDRLFGELRADLDQKQRIAEEIAGKWGMELPELSSLNKSDHNAAKAFMRSQHDDVRMAYGKRVSKFPRQMVCWGTTNDRKYLRDPTGNRSFWPVRARVQEIDTDGIRAERDALWAEALEMYLQMRQEQPQGELPLHLTGEAARTALELQEGARTNELHEHWADEARIWLDRPITLYEFKQMFSAELTGRENRQEYLTGDDDEKHIWIVRTAFRIKDIAKNALSKLGGAINDHSSSQTIQKMTHLLTEWESCGKDPARSNRIRDRWYFRVNATAEERNLGYRIVPDPDIEEDDLSEVI